VTDTRTAIVTGAAGAIGGACVARLVSDGFRVIAADRSQERLEKMDTGGGDVVPVVANVADPADLDAIVEAAGRVDALLNVAGTGDALMGLDELDDDRWDLVVAVNQTAAFRLSRRVVPQMLERGEGTIINLASVAGLRGGRAGIAYTASKWALIGMTQNIASTLGPQGIRAFAICPSGITGAVSLTDGGVSETGAARVRRDLRKPPPGKPQDVANLAAFLLGEESRHLNGVAIPLDAGLLAH